MNFRPVFVHALLGGDHLSGSALGVSESQDGFAGLAAGYSGESQVLGRFADPPTMFLVDTIYSADHLSLKTIIAPALESFTVLVGGTPARNTPRSTDGSPGKRSSMAIPSLGIMAGPRSEGGAEIVEMAPGSVAELANLHVGNVITSPWTANK